MNMNLDQIHPSMMPFSQKTLDCGRAGIANCRALIKEFNRHSVVKHNSRIAGKQDAFACDTQPEFQPALQQVAMEA